MSAKSIIKRSIEESVDALFTNARAIPADKLSWKPAEGTRSVLEVCQECAQAAGWATAMIVDRAVRLEVGVDMTEDSFADSQKERASWTTLDECERVCRDRTAKLLKAIDEFPEGDMDQTLFLPFTEKDHPYWDIMMYPYWNATWHTGQIAYVQCMLGDQEMH